jgi:hypothetical protein
VVGANDVTRGEELPLREISIAFTGEVRGEIEPCGCPTLPYGGFARRQTLLDRVGVELGRGIVHVDLGEALRKGLVTLEGDVVRDRGELILELMVLSGVEVYVPGPTDLATVGEEGLRSSGLNVISATWAAFPATTVVERDGLKLGFIGFSGAPAGEDGPDLKAVAAAAVAELRAQDVDLIVGLSNLPDGQGRQVAAVEGIGLMLSTKGSTHDAPSNVAGTAYLESPDRGRYVEFAHLQLRSTPDVPVMVHEDFSDAFVQYDESRRGRVRTERAEPDEAELRLGAELEEMGRGRNLVSLEERPLGSELDNSPSAVSGRLDDWRSERMDDAREAVESTPVEFTARFATASSCASCHPSQFARYGFTTHRNAGRTLVSAGREDDPECLECHTTGFGKPGGFADTDENAMRTYGGVQCESCHGPLQGHPRHAEAVPARVDEQTCLTCHDEANSPNFDYDQYLLEVICPVD